MNVLGRVHLRNTIVTPENYPNSPHVSGAITDGTFTECNIITSRIAKTDDEVTCAACRAIRDSQTHKIVKFATGKRVDYEEIMAMRARRKEINDLDLEEIEWYKDGKPMTIDPQKLEEFQFIGLSNVSFLTNELTEVSLAGGITIGCVKI